MVSAPLQMPVTVTFDAEQRSGLRFRRIALRCCSAMTTLSLATGALAQDAPQAGGNSHVVSTQPFPYGGLMVLVVMMGLSLFAVCRSSRRN